MLRSFALALSLAAAFTLTVARADTPAAWADAHLDKLVELYRQFHLHPELSNQEEDTAARVADAWKQLGAEVHTGIGGHGVVGILKNGPGPMLMLRTDLDALPVSENTGLTYASQVKVKNKNGSTTGVMHACGHDIHITNLIAVAQYLAANKSQWSGTVMLVGQPSEERGEGARRMLDDGLFKRFRKTRHGGRPARRRHARGGQNRAPLGLSAGQRR